MQYCKVSGLKVAKFRKAFSIESHPQNNKQNLCTKDSVDLIDTALHCPLTVLFMLHKFADSIFVQFHEDGTYAWSMCRLKSVTKFETEFIEKRLKL